MSGKRPQQRQAGGKGRSSRSNSTIPSKRPENRKTFQVIQWIFILLSFSLIVWLGKILIVDREDITASDYNPLTEEKMAEVRRGAILSADGKLLAYTDVAEDGSEIRRYPYGEAAAHVVGYIGRGQSGLEAILSGVLMEPSTLISQLQSWASEEKVQGCNVQTTLDIDLQNYIYEQLGDFQGAVVISEPSTGKILTLVSNPSFDPEAIVDDWETIINDERGPLYARATMGLYPPGSTFKIITALAMYRNMPAWRSYSYDCDGELEIGEQIIMCSDHRAHGYVEIEDAFAYSCNGFFGQAGIDMGWEALVGTASYVKLGNDFDFILDQNASEVQLSETDVDSMVAQTAMGQGETLVTPFAMNMLTCAIANDGVLYQPYLTQAVTDSKGNVLRSVDPLIWGTVMTKPEADFLENLMKGVTEYGTAARLSGYPYEVYGKTGTAQVGEDDDAHSWFTGYTVKDGKVDIAITVLVEKGAQMKEAVPLADAILAHFYGLQ